MILALCIAVPALFLAGMIYSALKEQQRLEREVLKPIVEKRKAERERVLKELEAQGDLEGAARMQKKPLFDPGDGDKAD